MKDTTGAGNATVALRLLLTLTVGFLSAGSLEAQTAGPGWTLNVHATNVSTVSGGEALAPDLAATGALFVKSLQDPGGHDVQLARVTSSGDVTILATFSSLRNSDISGIAIDPLTGGIIVADEVGESGGRIALINPSSLTVSTLFDIPWVMNPNTNGTGQQQYAPHPTNPNILYFWDSTLSKLFRLDRSTKALLELLALDQGTGVGRHLSTLLNDIVVDPATGTVLLSDFSSDTILEVDPDTTPATVTTLFSGLPGSLRAIALNPLTSEVFVMIANNSIFVGPRTGGSLSLVASGFTVLTDITVGNAKAGSGLSLFAVDKILNTLYEITKGSTDTIPPVIASVMASPNVLGPPNHKMVSVMITVSASDNSGAMPTCQVASVASNEPIDGLGDGDTSPDWEITAPLGVNLRAERAGNGNGRIYTITVRCTDKSGNSSSKAVAVAVPKSQVK